MLKIKFHFEIISVLIRNTVIQPLPLELHMTDAQSYYDGLISQGYTSDQAVTYTQQYYPNFQAAPAQPAEPIPPAVMPAPAVMATPQTMVSPSSEEGGIDIMAIAAVVCIALALILSAVGQFNGSWLSSDADETGQSSSSGLRTVTLDCSGVTNESAQVACTQMGVTILSEGMTNASIAEMTEKFSGETAVTGSMSDYCTNLYDYTIGLITLGETMTSAATGTTVEFTEERANASSAKSSCDEGVSAGSTGGIVLWIGTVVALAALVFAILGMVGVTLPGGIESHSKWVSLASGVLMVLAVLVWYLMLPSSEGSTMGASTGVFITVFAAVLSIVSGVLGIVGGMSKSS